MKLYQYSWVEMSGGFDQLVNIEASTQEKADEIFMERIASQYLKPKKFFKLVEKECVQDKYTKSYIKSSGGIVAFQRELPIHFYENSQVAAGNGNVESTITTIKQ